MQVRVALWGAATCRYRSLSILHPARPRGTEEQGAAGTELTVRPWPHSWCGDPRYASHS